MNQMEYINNNQEKNLRNKDMMNNEMTNNHIQLEKDICILINYVRTNPLDFCDNLISKNKYKKLSKEHFELINFLKDVYNNGVLLPFEEIPEISKAAKNLLNNLTLNNNKNQDLNLRKRLSQYGHRSGRIFETVVFKTDKAEDIINYILLEEKGRNMLLSNKMKYIGISCGILPQKMMCTVIDIVQDFIPFSRKNIEDTNDNNMNDNFDKSLYHKKYKSQNLLNLNEINYENNINNLKLKLENRENHINYNNGQNMNIIINNNHNQNNINNKNDFINNIFENNNNEYISNLFLNKYNNQREKNMHSKNNEYNKASSKKGSSMEEKENYFSPNSINSYNIIINNKISPKRNNLNNIIIIKKDYNNNNFSYNINQKKEIETRNNNNNHNNIEGKDVEKENKDMFTMAGRTCKEQKEVLEISNKMNLIKSKSLGLFDLNSNNSKNNKLQRLNFQEKIEILHKINQRNNKPKSLSSNKIIYEHIIDKTPFSTKTKDYNEINTIKYNSNLKRAQVGEKDKKFYFNTSKYLSSEKEKSNFINYECKTPIRFNTLIYKMNEFNRNNLNDNGITPSYPSYMETKSNQGNEICDINEEYSLNKLNEIKNDLIIFKNKIKKELKDEVKNEIKEEIKKEINTKKRPDSIEIEQDYEINNNILNDIISSKNNNYQSKEEKNNESENQVKIIDDEIYFKKNNGNYLAKNKIKNRCLSDKFFYVKKNINNNTQFLTNNNTNEINNSKERKKYISNIKDHILKDKYKETYDQLNFITKTTANKINRTSLKNINSNNDNNNISYEIKNKSFFNDNNKIKKRQEIKKLIKLYNIAKDSKRNINRSNMKNAYNIISYNKSIPDYFSRQNKCNTILKNSLKRNKINEECLNLLSDDEENYNKIQKSIFFNNNQLIKDEDEYKDQNNENYNNKVNCNQKTCYKIKSGGKIYNLMNDNNKRFLVEKTNRNNENENTENELNAIYDKKVKENINKEFDSFLNTKNEILSITGRFIEDNNEPNIIDNKDSEIKSYTEKSINIYKKGKNNKDITIKNKNKNIYIPSQYSKEKMDIKENHMHKNQKQDIFRISNSKTMPNINYIKNNNIKNEKYEKKIGGCFRGEKKGEKYETPNQIQKQAIIEENNNNKNKKYINFSNIITKKKTSYYKPKKYMSYHNFISINKNLKQKE